MFNNYFSTIKPNILLYLPLLNMIYILLSGRRQKFQKHYGQSAKRTTFQNNSVLIYYIHQIFRSKTEIKYLGNPQN